MYSGTCAIGATIPHLPHLNVEYMAKHLLSVQRQWGKGASPPCDLNLHVPSSLVDHLHNQYHITTSTSPQQCKTVPHFFAVSQKKSERCMSIVRHLLSVSRQWVKSAAVSNLTLNVPSYQSDHVHNHNHISTSTTPLHSISLLSCFTVACTHLPSY